jgi:hypothetical protein
LRSAVGMVRVMRVEVDAPGTCRRGGRDITLIPPPCPAAVRPRINAWQPFLFVLPVGRLEAMAKVQEEAVRAMVEVGAAAMVVVVGMRDGISGVGWLLWCWSKVVLLGGT